jgi:hypothetical protein
MQLSVPKQAAPVNVPSKTSTADWQAVTHDSATQFFPSIDQQHILVPSSFPMPQVRNLPTLPILRNRPFHPLPEMLALTACL